MQTFRYPYGGRTVRGVGAITNAPPVNPLQNLFGKQYAPSPVRAPAPVTLRTNQPTRYNPPPSISPINRRPLQFSPGSGGRIIGATVKATFGFPGIHGVGQDPNFDSGVIDPSTILDASASWPPPVDITPPVDSTPVLNPITDLTGVPGFDTTVPGDLTTPSPIDQASGVLGSAAPVNPGGTVLGTLASDASSVVGVLSGQGGSFSLPSLDTGNSLLNTILGAGLGFGAAELTGALGGTSSSKQGGVTGTKKPGGSSTNPSSTSGLSSGLGVVALLAVAVLMMGNK